MLVYLVIVMELSEADTGNEGPCYSVRAAIALAHTQRCTNLNLIFRFHNSCQKLLTAGVEKELFKEDNNVNPLHYLSGTLPINPSVPYTILFVGIEPYTLLPQTAVIA